MTARPKQIVLDKDAFIGIGLEALCDFVKDHMLILCDTLWYECATAEKNPGGLIRRCRRVVEEGGYICLGNHAAFLQWEGRHCAPYPYCLADLNVTADVRNGDILCEDMPTSLAAKQAAESRQTMAKRMLVEPCEELKRVIDVEHPNVVKVLKNSQEARAERFRGFMTSVDKSDMRETALKNIPFGDWITDPTRFCLSPDWVSWHLERLVDAMVLEYHYIRQTGGSRDEHAEHDLQDVEYVLLLSRAHAIISRDRELVQPLARAAFPEKDAFSSLEEVPESYRCDWKA